MRTAPFTRALRAIALVVAALLLGGCATSSRPPTWRDPGYAGPQFRKVFVVGLSSRDLVDQRGFEDLMVSTMKSFGVVAVPGWQYVPTDRTPDTATMRDAVAKSGADAVLLVRMSGFTTQSELVTVPDPLGPYNGWYEPTAVVQYQQATIYTTLYDVRSARPVWTYNPPSYDPSTLQQQAPRYANEVVGLLQSSGLLAIR